MKKIALKTYGKLLAFILSFFGLSNCDIVEPRVEYGTPSADYIVKGKVIVEGTNTPIEGIGIIVPDRQQKNYGDTVYTDARGEYTIELKGVFPFGTEKMKVIAKDLDEDKNGLFQADSTEISFTKNDLVKKGSGNWHEGTYQKTNQNFSLDHAVVAEYGVRQAPFKDIDKNKNQNP